MRIHKNMNSAKQCNRERFIGMIGPQRKEFGELFKYIGHFLTGSYSY
jgi:hypothetical protein